MHQVMNLERLKLFEGVKMMDSRNILDSGDARDNISLVTLTSPVMRPVKYDRMIFQQICQTSHLMVGC